jgi:hypothetical protein
MITAHPLIYNPGLRQNTYYKQQAAGCRVQSAGPGWVIHLHTGWVNRGFTKAAETYQPQWGGLGG